MASSIQFMRGLQAKVNAANIKDGQPALVRRSGKTPLLFVGNGSGVGKAVQLAPDIDMYGNLGVTSGEAFYIRRNTENANNWSQIYFDKLDDAQYAGVLYPYHSANVDLGKQSNRFRNSYLRTIETKQINAEDTTSIIGQAASPFMSSYVLRQLTPIIESVYNPDDGSQTGNTELQLRSYPGAANATTASKVGTAAFVLRSSKWVSDANQYSYAKVLLEPDASSPNNAVIRPDVDGRGFLGTSTYQWNSVYSKYINAYNAIIFSGVLPASDGSVSIGSDALRFGAGYFMAIDANGQSTMEGITTGAGGIVPAATANSNIGSSDKRYTTGYFVSMNLTSGATIDGTIAPSYTGGATLGTSTNRFGNCYFGNITVGSITPINGTSYSLGTSSAPFNSAYINTATIKTALNPDTSGGATIGSSTLPWGAAYVGTVYSLGILPRVSGAYSIGNPSTYFYAAHIATPYVRSGSSWYAVPAIMSDDTAPSSSTGENGDIFIQYA